MGPVQCGAMLTLKLTTSNLSRVLFLFPQKGLMSLAVAKYLVQIPASVYLIDCLPNMQAVNVTANTAPLVHFIRQARPDTPIVLSEGVHVQVCVCVCVCASVCAYVKGPLCV